MKDYIVTFDTYSNRIAAHWQIGVTAKNAKLAIAAARTRWTFWEQRKPHQFHIEAHRGKAAEEFVRLEWKHYSWGYRG